jgi:hypothetical protein
MQLYYPSEVLNEDQAEKFVGDIRSIAALLPFTSGYASPALQWAEGSDLAKRNSKAIIARHPGYDVQLNELGRKRLGLRVRGARWLSFLGSDITAKLGGMETLRHSLDDGITVEAVGKGIMIRAGELPEIGDKNQGVETPLLCSVARAIEPITAFQEIVLLSAFEQDAEFLQKWERRFLD